MAIIPKYFLADIYPGSLIQGENRVSLRINESACDIERYKGDYSKRIFNFDIEDDIYLDKGVIEDLQGFRVRIVASNAVFDIGKMLDSYRKMVPVFSAVVDENLHKKINYLTAFGFQVHLNTSIPPSDANVLEKALDFYLHNPLLKTPVEPFHSLLKTLSAGSGYTLWETEYENFKTNIYISDSGEASLSKRWYGKDLVYGRVDDPWKKLSSSDLYNRLKSFKKDLFRQKSECIYCSHMDICGGFLKAVEPDWPCESWISVFDILRKEAENAREILKKHSGDRR